MGRTKVIIAGAGIGGLTSALCLHKAGFDVQLYESAREINHWVLASITKQRYMSYS